MEQFIAKKFAQRYLASHTSKKKDSEDFFYIREPKLDQRGRHTGKYKNIKKRPPPPGLTKKEEDVLKTVMTRARWLDNSFNVGGIRVGWSAIFGIVPFVGDFFDSLMALWVVNKALELEAGKEIQTRMMANVMIDFFIGLVPFIGDLGDALFRANTMNAAMLYETLREKGAERIRREDRQAAAAAARNESSPNVTRPEPTKPKSGGYLQRFNFFGKQSQERQPDLERADGGHSGEEPQGKSRRSDR